MVVYKSAEAAVRAARATEYVVEIGKSRWQVADGVESAFRAATSAYGGNGHGAFAEAKDDLWEMLRGWDSVEVPVVTESGGWWTVQAAGVVS